MNWIGKCTFLPLCLCIMSAVKYNCAGEHTHTQKEMKWESADARTSETATVHVLLACLLEALWKWTRCLVCTTRHERNLTLAKKQTGCQAVSLTEVSFWETIGCAQKTAWSEKGSPKNLVLMLLIQLMSCTQQINQRLLRGYHHINCTEK